METEAERPQAQDQQAASVRGALAVGAASGGVVWAAAVNEPQRRAMPSHKVASSFFITMPFRSGIQLSRLDHKACESNVIRQRAPRLDEGSVRPGERLAAEEAVAC